MSSYFAERNYHKEQLINRSALSLRCIPGLFNVEMSVIIHAYIYIFIEVIVCIWVGVFCLCLFHCVDLVLNFMYFFNNASDMVQIASLIICSE